MKRCNICGQNKESTEFYTNNRKCKTCFSAETQARKKGTVLPERFCVRCETIKTKEHFPIAGKSLRPYCNSCESPEDMHWCIVCKEHKPADGFRHRANGSKCGDCRREYERTRSLQRYYGITPEDYTRAYNHQKGKCWICHTEAETLVVDHNHASKTGFRGLLCANCNTGLGMFKDEPLLLDRAKNYLHAFGHYGTNDWNVTK